MAPRLHAVAGPLDGMLIPIGKRLSIGRDTANTCVLDDEAIAPQHCLIEKHGASHRLTHLGRDVPTFLNGLQVKDASLAHGDHLKIGRSTFLVLLDRAEPRTPCAPFVEDLEPGSVTRLALSSARGRPGVGRVPVPRASADADSTLAIGAAAVSLQELAAFEHPLLALLLDALPAERAALLLAEGEPPRLESIVVQDRQTTAERPALRVCRSLVDAALAQKTSVLSNDVRVPGAAGAGDRTTAVVAAPVHGFGFTFGVLYLESDNTRFDTHHLQLLTLIGEIAALAFEHRRHVEYLEFENRRLHAEIGGMHDMVGDSLVMQDLHRLITRISRSDSTVLVTGESGTGKELVARAIHRNSRRSKRPFVAINCAAIPEALLETELFGHEKGAFTSAAGRKLGRLETARGGTVFLDEISELSLALQPKLLRVLEEHRCERVGGLEPIELDIRVVAATNTNLAQAIAARRFRADLYYRLNVVAAVLPPLRARREDIGPLAAHFARTFGERLGRRIVGISPEAEALMTSYDWPGNVRELENVIERALVLGTGDVIGVEDLPETLLEQRHPESSPASRYHQAVWQAKKDLVVKAVEQAGGNLSAAARLLGLNANYLHRLVRDMDLRAVVRHERHE